MATACTAGARGERREAPGRVVWGQSRGALSGFARGAARGLARWPAPVYGAVTARNRERSEERDTVNGIFVIRSKFNIHSVNSIFLLLLCLK